MTTNSDSLHDILKSMRLTDHSDIENLLFKFGLSSKDLDYIRKISSLITDEDLVEISRRVLDLFQTFDETSEIIGYPQSESCILTGHMVKYFRELLQGNYDLSYCRSRVQVGIRHDEIGITPKFFLCAYTIWILGIKEIIERIISPPDLKPVIHSVWKVANMDKALVFEAYTNHKALKLTREKQRISDLNRMLRVTYSINELIVRASDIEALFKETVKTLVTEGDFLLSWIGKLDPVTKRITPVASYGLTEYLNGIFISADPSIPEGRGPTGTAVREGTIQIVTSTESSEKFSPWRERALKFGIASSAAIPLGIPEVQAVLNVYSEKKSFFSEDELSLLSAIASDLGYAMKHIAQVKAHKELAVKDTLTELYSLTYIREWAGWYLRKANKSERIIFIDLDIRGFSKINSVFGFSTGDRILVEIAERLKTFCGGAGKVGRVTGDEFILIMPLDADNPYRIVEELSDVIESTINLFDTTITLDAFFGVAVFPDDGTEPGDLLHFANTALLEAKQSGKSCCVFYNDRLLENIKKEIEIETGIRSAISNRNLALYLQPKVSLKTREVIGFEALIRWHHPKNGVIFPGSFIPLLEKSGLIIEVGWWIVDEVLRLLKESKLFKDSKRFISFNVSVAQFENEHFVPLLIDKLQNAGVDPRRIIIEVTESLFVKTPKEMIEKIRFIREQGVRISIDDFGTGYSSLSYLKDIPASYLKIDISFVRKLPHDITSGEIVKTILLLARGLKKKTVAEGVEKPEQLIFLMQQGVDDVQGFYFAKPMPEDEAVEWLNSYDPGRYFPR